MYFWYCYRRRNLKYGMQLQLVMLRVLASSGVDVTGVITDDVSLFVSVDYSILFDIVHIYVC